MGGSMSSPSGGDDKGAGAPKASQLPVATSTTRSPTPTSANQPPPPAALVVCGPSGVGKGTLIKRLMEKYPGKFGFSCSHTTRAPREGEQDGVHYHFVSKDQFLAGISQGHFLEHAEVHGNRYGTSRRAVERVAADGRCCVLDIDVQGARSVKRSGLPAVFAFVAPPSLEELETRLRGRGTESGAAVERRLSAAWDEIESLVNDADDGLWDFVIVNDDFDEAAAQLSAVARRALAGKTGNGTNAVSSSSNGSSSSRSSSVGHGVGSGGGGGSSGRKEEEAGDAAAAATATATARHEEVPMTPNGTTSLAAFSVSNGAAAAAAGSLLGDRAARRNRSLSASAASASASAAAAAAAVASTSTSSTSSVSPSAPADRCPPLANRSWPKGYSASACLAGRVVAVTGASAGIGRALCLQLAAMVPRVKVVGLARRGDRLEELAAEIKKRHEDFVAAMSSSSSSFPSSSPPPPPPEFLPVICDITREAEVSALPKIVRARWGEAAGVDVLVNNAGMSRHDSALLDGNPSAWAAMLNVNVLAPALLTRVVVADLRERIKRAAEAEEEAKKKKESTKSKKKSSTSAAAGVDATADADALSPLLQPPPPPSHARPAHIVNVSSMMAHRVYVYPGCGGLYAATKHALRAMTEGLRLEARAAKLPLRVSLVSPGRVATEFFSAMHDGDPPAAFPPAVDGSSSSEGPAPAMTADDVAGAVLFVLAAPPGVDVNDVLLRPVGQTV